MKLAPILAAMGVLAMTAVVGYSIYATNMEDRRKVAEAPVISSVLPGNTKTLWAICSKETNTKNQRHLCVEKFKKLNPNIGIGRLQRNTFYRFPDVNNDGRIGERKD